MSSVYPKDCRALKAAFDRMQSSKAFKDSVARAEKALGITEETRRQAREFKKLLLRDD